jgi:hypothetical protein
MDAKKPKRLEPVTNKDIEREYKKLSGMSQNEKDAALAFLFVAVARMTEILRDIAENELKSEKEKLLEVEEIEQILSLGPTWLNFTRKTKAKKKKKPQ